MLGLVGGLVEVERVVCIGVEAAENIVVASGVDRSKGSHRGLKGRRGGGRQVREWSIRGPG